MARPPALLIAFSILLGAGCQRLPVFFAPPQQKASLASSHFVVMSDPEAGSYIVQGFRNHSEGPWRWALDHPVLRFDLPDAGPLKFTMDFTLPEATFRQTGPVTLALALNGRPFDRIRGDHPGDYHYEHPVPTGRLHEPGENLVAIDPDRTATPEKLGFVLLRAGFVE